MVSDQEIAKGIETVLRQSDPTTVTTLNGVVSQLEAKLGLNLSHKSAFIRDQVNLLLRSHPHSPSAVVSAPPPPQQPPATSAAAPSVVISQSHQPPLPILLHSHHQQQQLYSTKDHFVLQHPQFQQFSPHFALHSHHHHQVFPQDLNFRQPQAQHYTQLPRQHQQHQPPPLVKNDVYSTNANSVPVDLAKESIPVAGKRRGGPGGLNKVCGVSPELQAVVGEPRLPRTEIVRQLWAYIRKNNLQDPSNKRKIICDDALRVVFETDCTDMFKMNKLLAKHIIPLEPTKDVQAKRVKVDDELITEKAEPVESKTVISDALAKFLGCSEREMTQLEASKHVWEYIKLNSLEDPLNSMVILCDEKLRELLGCESISAVGVVEMLARHHLLKRS